MILVIVTIIDYTQLLKVLISLEWLILIYYGGVLNADKKKFDKNYTF